MNNMIWFNKAPGTWGLSDGAEVHVEAGWGLAANLDRQGGGGGNYIPKTDFLFCFF